MTLQKQKHYFNFFGITIITTVLILFLISCSMDNPNQTGNSVVINKLDLGSLENFLVNLEDATALGIKSLSVSNSRSTTNSSRNVVVKTTDLDGSIETAEPIVFEVMNDLGGSLKDFGDNPLRVGDIISQEDMPAQVDKLYVSRDFTYISFIPFFTAEQMQNLTVASSTYIQGIGSWVTDYYIDYMDDSGSIKSDSLSIRPDNQYLLPTEEPGVYHYDTWNYFSSDLRQSFIIHNDSGTIYKIDGFRIDSLKNGIPTINGIGLARVSVNESMELEISSIVRNQTIRIYDYFQDKYGQVYIFNDLLDGIDEASNVLYFTKTASYILSKEGVVLFLDYDGTFNYSEMPSSYSTIAIVGDNFTLNTLSAETKLTFNYSPLNGNSNHKSSVIIHHLSEGFLFLTSFQGGAYSYFQKVNLMSDYGITRYSFGSYGSAGGYWTSRCLKSTPISFDTVLIWTDLIDNEKNLYYAKPYEQDEYRGEDINQIQALENLQKNLLLENCVEDGGWPENGNGLRLKRTTFDGTEYYRVILDQDSNRPVVVNESSYSSIDTQTIKLQPLNLT